MKDYSAESAKRARRLRSDSTDAERRLWRMLRNRNLDHYKFRRQHPIRGYFADFVCLDKRLIIELDGGQHAQQIARDAARTADLESAGFRVLRFWDNDVLTRPEAVLQTIFAELGVPSP